MSDLLIDDAREFIFPFFLVKGTGPSDVDLVDRQFLGTGFFVTSKGDAITAAHVIPATRNIPAAKTVVAIVQQGDKQLVCFVTHVAMFEKDDFALVHLQVENTKFLEISDVPVLGGTDVEMIGIPSDEVWMSGKEMRILKGHVTMAGPHLELNIAIPPGMSGSPIFVGQRVVAFASKSVKSEEVEDYFEEVVKISDTKEQIVITKVVRATHYGLALPFSRYVDAKPSVFNGMTLLQLVAHLNAREAVEETPP